jgi:hypothetical protein
MAGRGSNIRVSPQSAESPRFAVATPGDDAAIRRLLRDNPMPGAVSLSLEREPDYFRGSNIAGATDQTILVSQNNRAVCVGRCSLRRHWINGQLLPAGYLSELRLDAGAKARFDLIRRGYRFFKDLQRDRFAELYFTSIATDNERGRRLLERGVRGLPRYTYLASFTTLLIAVPRNPGRGPILSKPCPPERISDVASLLGAHGRQHQLAAGWTGTDLEALQGHGLPLEHIRIAIEDGEIVACGGVWDQRIFRQTVIRGYSPALTAARPLVNFASRFLPVPRLPAAGSVLAHAFLSPLAFQPGREAMLPDFVQSILPHAASRGLEFLTIGLNAREPRLAELRRRFTTRSYQSRLYGVNWEGETSARFHSGENSFLPDVALL